MVSPYQTVLLDPPWPERGAGKIKRGADRHYELIKKKWQIAEVILQAPVWQPAEHCHLYLYLWVTNNYLAWGLWLMEVLGFAYKTNVVWRKRRLATDKELVELVKLYVGDPSKGTEGNPEAALARLHELQDTRQAGLGQYFRGEHELLLFGVRGRGPLVRTSRKDLGTSLPAERTKHSLKPGEAHELIEARSEGPYLEMFARNRRPGWDSWGNEVEAA